MLVLQPLRAELSRMAGHVPLLPQASLHSRWRQPWRLRPTASTWLPAGDPLEQRKCCVCWCLSRWRRLRASRQRMGGRRLRWHSSEWCTCQPRPQADPTTTLSHAHSASIAEEDAMFIVTASTTAESRVGRLLYTEGRDAVPFHTTVAGGCMEQGSELSVGRDAACLRG